MTNMRLMAILIDYLLQGERAVVPSMHCRIRRHRTGQNINGGVDFSSREVNFVSGVIVQGQERAFMLLHFVICHEHYHELLSPSRYHSSMPNALRAMQGYLIIHVHRAISRTRSRHFPL